MSRISSRPGRPWNNCKQPAPSRLLVNNAGIYDDAPMAGMTPEQWRSVIDVSLNGFFNVTQPLLLPMIRTRWGRIVTITSISGGDRQPWAGQLCRGQGRAPWGDESPRAGAGLTRHHGQCRGARGHLHLRHPGIFDTESISRLVPMKRAGTAEEVASLVAYLVSDSASYISGQIISINGAQA